MSSRLVVTATQGVNPRPLQEYICGLTKGPVASEHESEVGDNIEGGVDDIGHGQVHCVHSTSQYKIVRVIQYVPVHAY